MLSRYHAVLGDVYVMHIFRLESVVAGSSRACKKGMLFVKELEAAIFKKKVDSVIVLSEQLSVQAFALRKMLFLENMYKDEILFRKGRLIPILQ